MNILESHKNDIIKLRAELSIAKKQCTSLESLIRQKQSQMEKITFAINKKSDKVLRDVELCKEFISKNPNCPSKDIVKFLNNKLNGKPKRWVVLDWNTFMTVMGNHLQESGLFTSTKKVVDGNQTYIWKIK